jgi:hypothetical protein
MARIEWQDGGGVWRPWVPGGGDRQGRSRRPLVSRFSVVTRLPLLTVRQVARLPAEAIQYRPGRQL